VKSEERRKTRQRNGHAPQASHPPAQKAPGHAPQLSLPRPVADALGCREIGSGPRLPVRALASAPGEDHEVTRKTFQFHVDKKKLQEAEWRDGHYWPTLQPDRRRSQRAVGTLRAADADRRSGVNSAYAPFTIHWNIAPTLTSRLPFSPAVCRSPASIAYGRTLRG